MKHLFLIGVILSSLVNIGNENIAINEITRSENDKLYASSTNSKIDITLTKYNYYNYESLDISFNYVTNNLVVESEKACDIELTNTNIYNKHERSYNNKYLQYNKNKHYAYCECGAKTLLSHTVIVDSNNNRTCIYCNADLKSGGAGIVIPGF